MKRTLRLVLLFSLSVLAAAAGFAAGSGGGGGGGGSARGSGGGSASQPTSAVDWYNVGYDAANKGQFQAGLEDFQKAIALRSDYAEAYNMLGYCTRKLGDPAKAIGYYETALRLKPNFAEAREYYGEAWLQQDNLAKAVQQYIILEKSSRKNAAELLEKIGEYVNSGQG